MRGTRTGVAVFLSAILPLATAGVSRSEDSAPRTTERELLAVLRSETPEADKALAFKRLAVDGSSACVADVATFLGNERLSSWARITLEAIPGDEAAAALRAAAGTLSGRPLVGVVNSLGVRRDAEAVPLLQERLAGADADVAAAAAAALGSIGTAEAGVALARALAAGQPDRDAVAEACVVCGERLLAAGESAQAIGMFDAVRAAPVSEQRHAEATRAAILARGRDGLPLLAELLQSPAARPFAMGLFTAREFAVGPGRDSAVAYEVDLAILKSLAAASSAAGRRPQLIELLADRNPGGCPAAVRQALLEAARDDDMAVRLAAIRAIGRCGDAAAAAGLLERVAAAGPAVAAAVRQAVAGMRAEGVNEVIMARLGGSDAASLPVAVALVGDRRIVAAGDAVLPLVDHADPAIRQAALAALGSVVGLDDLGILVSKAAAPRDEAESAAAAAALREAAVRMVDRDACAAAIAAAIGKAGPRAAVLVETLGDVGGGRALTAVADAAATGDAALQDVATRVLGKWMTADAAPVLLDLASTDKAGSFRGRALKGYLRIARQFALPESERAEMCRRALAVAEDPADRRSVIEILVRYPHPATLAVAREAAALPDADDEAKKAVATIEGKLPQPAGAK